MTPTSDIHESIPLRARLAIVAALAAVALIVPVAAATAGVYTVHSCRTPEGSATVDEWRVTMLSGSTSTSRNDCPAGRLELQMRPDITHAANDYVRAGFHAPTDTDIEAYRIWRTVRLASPYNYYLREITSTGSHVDFNVCTGSCTAIGGTPALGQANVVERAGLTDVHGLDFMLSCALADSSSERCDASAPAAQLRLHRADITLRDQLAPAFSAPPSGPLVGATTPLAGSQAVSVSAVDRGSGVYQLQFEVDGTIVQTDTINDNGGQCRPPFTQSVPCMLGASGTVAFDTTRLADGAHSLRLLITDATGTNTAAWGPITIQTANASCNPNPRVDTLDMWAGVVRGGGKRRRLRVKVTTASKRRVRLQGRLRTPQGAAVPGAEVCVAERTAVADAELLARGSLVTDRDGRFSYVVRRGPSRTLYFVHRVEGGAVSAAVRYRVRAPARLDGSPTSLRTGQAIKLRGRLAGRPMPQRGALVEIQARTQAGWQTFKTVRTNQRGRFKAAYRFARTRGVRTYHLRAKVPGQAAYPYATGKSKPVRVVVRG